MNLFSASGAIVIRSATRIYASPSLPGSQHGIALVMALVMLMILTILGLTAMSTASLEEKMSGNIQETTRAFMAAESGINSAFNTTGLLNPNATVTQNYNFDSQKSGSATVEASFREYQPPGRSKNPNEIYSATNLQEAHFDVKSTGTTLTNAKTVLHQGLSQVVSKSD